MKTDASAFESADRLQRAAAREGFDWRHLDELWDKLDEEIAELKEAVSIGPDKVHEELGDLLFMMVNLARHLNVNCADALTGANRKFQRRYGVVQSRRADWPPMEDPRRLQFMEALWQKAKQAERCRPTMNQTDQDTNQK